MKEGDGKFGALSSILRHRRDKDVKQIRVRLEEREVRNEWWKETKKVSEKKKVS